MNKQPIFIIIIVLLLTGCGLLETPPSPTSPPPTQTTKPTPTPTKTLTPTPTPIIVGPVIGGPTGTEGFPWWNDTVFYEIFVRTFCDSDGNGLGDFNGVTEKLDYLQQLGIKGIYLMMIMQDDITEQHPERGVVPWRPSDYRAVFHEYGTMEDFKRLLSEAHKHGIHVIIDFVIHSTSTNHPWFQSSRNSDSSYRDWYIWSDRDRGLSDWGTQVWFKDSSGYYLSIAGPEVALLNLKNPNVTAALYDVTKFWLQDIGVDGFRLDNVKQLIPELPSFSNTKSTHDWLKQFHLFYKGISPDSMTFGEVWESNPNILQAYVQGDETDLVTEFDFVWSIAPAVNSGKNSDVVRALGEGNRLMPNQQFLTFINNHDTDRVMSESPSFNGGVGVGVGENPQKAKVAASLYLTAPGVPILYYGEEIGMRGIKLDAQGVWVSDNYRRVMQWRSDRIAAGFSTRYPPSNSNIYTDEWDYIDVYNVASELNDPNSLLSHYRSLIALRNTHPALRIGDQNLVTTSTPGLFASLRVSSDEAVLVVINLTDMPISNFSLSLNNSPLQGGKHLALPLMGQGPFGELNVTSTGGFYNYSPITEIPAYATLIIQFSPK